VYVMLFPDAVQANDWRNTPAEFRAGRSFRTSYAQPETNELQLRINPVRPGRYWLKAIWDRQPPFFYDLWSWDGVEAWKTSTNNSIAFESGDAESGAPKMFEVKANESVSVRLECRTIE